MLRIRLFWFSIGFAATSASISHFVWRDLLAHRCALSSDMERNFEALEARISNLESVRHRNSIPSAEQAND
ncbi:uncharacterized protein LOC120085616 isoform X2 [Benincasa hispida]|uniref:uncharacterized protein LOC120085616 isoform X2 n=1 Tax=Benincasa hispida TaxID=102211 RepID=UPI001900AF69|nr:uncharacterized protein LOC120085616 isoform X2 [Benincasa hispida]XP_038897619.1 uncharacterized protein LOC120085616 isoform X2 [Benincasa hispida]